MSYEKLSRPGAGGAQRVRPLAGLAAAWGLLAGAAGAGAQPVINEFVLNHTGTDTNEFLEVYGGPSTDYSSYRILEIEGDSGSTVGVVDGVFAVGTTDAAGLWVSAFINNDLENGSLTLLLVDGFTGAVGTDLDTNDDGILDAMPWTALADDVAVSDGGASDLTYAATVLTAGFDGDLNVPGGASRIPDGQDTGMVADWLRNDFDGEGLPGFIGTPVIGEALNTPGLPNEAVGPVDPVLNEFVRDHTGSDTNEYLEVTADPLGDYSAYWLLEIEGDGAPGAGTVDGVYQVGTTDANGLWVTPFLVSEIENGSVTLLLVEAFTGAAGQDLDTNDDGLFDSTPWTRVVDDVAATDGGVSDVVYSTTVLVPGYDGVSFTVGGASRIPDGADTDTVADWMRNDFDGEGLPGFIGTPVLGEAINTPGLPNEAFVPPPAGLGWVINEIHADPATDVDCAALGQPAGCGDANGDGVTDSTQDEFVELVWDDVVAADLSGWTLSDSVSVRHTFPGGTVIPAGCGVVVFGGGTPTGAFGGMTVQVASTGSLGLNNSGDTLSLKDALGTVIATVTYGAEGGNNQSLTLDPDLTGLTYVQHTLAAGSGGTVSSPGTKVDGTDFAGCGGGPTGTPICEIQGTGLASPLAGQQVTTAGNVVTAVGVNGFYHQSPADCDGVAESSDGLFVFTSTPPAVAVGDVVTVTGTVQEFFELTEISSAVFTVTGGGQPLPAPVVFDETRPSPVQPQPDTELERFEGMRVRFVNGVASGPSDRFGDVPVVAKSTLVFREPGIAYPGLPDLPVWDGNPEVFEIDPDGLGLPDADIYRGQAILECEGPLHFSFGDYIVYPQTLVLGPEPVLPVPVRDRIGAEFTVGSFNLLRLYDEFDDPLTDDDVPSNAEVEDRLARFSDYIRNVLKAPEVLAVQEVENLSILERLASRILADDPAVSYTALLAEGNDIGGIDVGFLLQSNVQLIRAMQLYKDLTWDYNGEIDLLFDRPPVAIGVRVGGFPLFVLNNHSRSLGGIEDPLDGDRVRQKRHNQAVRVSQLVRTQQQAFPQFPLLVTGDLNAFEFTDGYVDVVGQITGAPDPLGALIPVIDLVDPNLANEIARQPAAERYSFIFDGSAQTLDHMLTSVPLQPFITGLERARGNADSPEGFETDPPVDNRVLGVSDHDAAMIYIDPTVAP